MKKIKLMEAMIISIISFVCLGVIGTTLIKSKMKRGEAVNLPSTSDAMLKDITSIDKSQKWGIMDTKNENEELNSSNKSVYKEKTISPPPSLGNSPIENSPIENSPIENSPVEKNNDDDITKNQPGGTPHKKKANEEAATTETSTTETSTAIIPLPPASTPLAYGGWIGGGWVGGGALSWFYQTPSISKPVSDTLGY